MDLTAIVFCSRFSTTSTTVFYLPFTQVLRKMNLKFWMSSFFLGVTQLEPGVVPAAENYVELFKNSYFTDVPTLMGDLKAFFSFQIEHLTLKFPGFVQCYIILC